MVWVMRMVMMPEPVSELTSGMPLHACAFVRLTVCRIEVDRNDRMSCRVDPHVQQGIDRGLTPAQNGNSRGYPFLKTANECLRGKRANESSYRLEGRDGGGEMDSKRLWAHHFAQHMRLETQCWQ